MGGGAGARAPLHRLAQELADALLGLVVTRIRDEVDAERAKVVAREDRTGDGVPAPARDLQAVGAAVGIFDRIAALRVGLGRERAGRIVVPDRVVPGRCDRYLDVDGRNGVFPRR
jgi:hypothetical protein